MELVQPAPIKANKIKWVIITKDNYETIFKELEKNNHDVVLFGLTDDSYKKLSLNFAEIFKYISTQKIIIQSYKNYYEPKEENE